MKNIFKIIFVIIGTLIGAGFASGQEMYIFFLSYGVKGIIGIFISSVLMGIVIYKTLKIIDKYNITNYKDFINIIINHKFTKKYFNINNIFNIIINLFILITFFIMIAGFGAYFNQVIKINSFIGSAILASLCFIIFLGSVKRFVKINEILIPILIVFIFIIGIINLDKIANINLNNINNFILHEKSNNLFSWIISSILYCSYNSILLIPVLITLKNYIKNKNQILIISIISIIVIIILSVILFLNLINIDNNIISNLEMPMVYVANQMGKIINLLYGFVIIASIFTTSISLGISFLQNFAKNKKSYTQIAAIMCITSIGMSQFGFSNLVNLLYPIFGYLGLIQILIIINNK